MGIKLCLHDRMMLARCRLCFISDHPALFLKRGNGQHVAVHACQLVTGFKEESGQGSAIDRIHPLFLYGREMQGDASFIGVGHDPQAQSAIRVTDPSLAR